ncbi:Uncharacterised protein [Listeria fleischmannii subsp. coloradonensis]|nr:Uncharacterised protein [Listeria fleischmannii subsp. coloradonensis]
MVDSFQLVENSKITQNKTILTKARLLTNGKILGKTSVAERSVLEYVSTGTEGLTTKIAVCQQSGRSHWLTPF